MSSAAGARESGEGSCSYNLTAATGTTVSPPDDPWPINPNGSTVEAYNSQLWNEGFNIVITCVGARGWMGAGGGVLSFVSLLLQNSPKENRV